MESLNGKLGDLTADHVRNWLQLHGWEHGYDSGGNSGIVSPCKEFSVAEYWLKEPRGLHIAVEHICDCLDLNPFTLIEEMKKLRAGVESAVAEATT